MGSKSFTVAMSPGDLSHYVRLHQPRLYMQTTVRSADAKAGHMFVKVQQDELLAFLMVTSHLVHQFQVQVFEKDVYIIPVNKERP